MNRAGRFDSSYKIENPSEEMRRRYFASKNLKNILGKFDLNKYKHGNEKDMIELFVAHTDDMPMANLKETITSVAYLLVSGDEKYIERAIEKVTNRVHGNRENHINSHNQYMNQAKFNLPELPMFKPEKKHKKKKSIPDKKEKKKEERIKLKLKRKK